ncbi:transcriptional regulator with XRE-family HTH domain [Devosia sp. UYZn731]|uniref:helix-turn-helix domain-containing protein n=1 Tax=Devosia sp. UYZn731 TaxID=3156345 RepID=UPI00339712F4
MQDRAHLVGTYPLGDLLRHWRTVRGASQLDLSLDTGTSQRQISFIESGRSVPRRETLMALADALDVPLRERNGLLLAAGYAPLFPEIPWDDDAMRAVTRALRRMLEQQLPYPGIVMDRYWNVLDANAATTRLFGSFVDLAARRQSRNMLHLLFDPSGLRQHVDDWPTVAKSFLQRIGREAVGRIKDQEMEQLTQTLLAYPGVDNDWIKPSPSASSLPVIPIGLRHNDGVLRYFSLVATVGTPLTVAAEEIRVELMFPADDWTDAQHLRLVGDVAKTTGQGT